MKTTKKTVVNAIHFRVQTNGKIHAMVLINGQYMEAIYRCWTEATQFIRLLDALGKTFSVFVR